MSSFVRQSRLLGTRPVVVNNLNVSAGAGRAADAAHPRRGEHPLPRVRPRAARAELGGHLPAVLRHGVPRDFVEFPSQVNEMWALWPRGARQLRAARRHRGAAAAGGRRGDRRRPALGRGLRHPGVPGRDAARPGLAPDHARHRDRRPDRVRASGAGRGRGRAPTLVPPRYRTTYFQHIFAGGYAAGYYSYIWSEVLDADTVEWFKENGGLRRANGDAFRSKLLVRRWLGRPAGRVPRRPRPGRRPAPAAPAPRAWRPTRLSRDPTALRVLRSRACGSCRARRSANNIAQRGRWPALTARAARAPGPGRRGVAVADQPVGLPVAARRAAVHHLPALARLLHQPDRLHGRPALARPVAGQVVDVQRPQAVRAVVAVVPVGVRRHRARAVHARRSRCSPPAGSGPPHRGQRSGDERLDGDDLDGDVAAVGRLVGHRRARARRP